jgi:hypothetical protein
MTTYSLFSLLTVALAGCNMEGFWKMSEAEAPQEIYSADSNAVRDVRIAGAQEVDMVEQVLNYRARYRQSLTQLRDFYRDRGYNSKRQWADYELADLSNIKTYKYILDAEIPASELRPRNAIVEADELYRKGLDLMKRGGHGIPALYREDMMCEALNTFVELITKYPSSDKIDDAAFYCGEIHKEYFKNQDEIAVEWYERAYAWDPQTPHPVRFQAAVVYDYRLHDRARALELYHAVLQEETENKSNTSWASRRIYELTDGRGYAPLPRPATENRSQPSASSAMASPRAEASSVSTPQAPQSRSRPPASAASQPQEKDDRIAAEELVPVVDLGPLDEDE